MTGRRTARPDARLPLVARAAANLVNGSTLAGLLVAKLGGARVSPAPERLMIATGYRLRVPPAPAFTMGNVIITRRGELDVGSDLFRHEARHSTQYAWCGGLLMLPLYFASAGASWLLCGDVGAWNPFERAAGLTAGGYLDRPFRITAWAPQASGSGVPGRGPEPGEPGE